MFLNNQQVTKEIKREIKEFIEMNNNEKKNNAKPMRCNKSSSKRKAYSNTILPQETRKTWNRQSNLHLKQLGKEEQKKISKRK